MHASKNTLNLDKPVSLPETLGLLFVQLRPRQWTKNLLVFGALAFSTKKLDWDNLLQTCAAFVLFCLISGSVYIMNDYMDRESDRLHPDKIKRPMASGRLNPALALSVGAGLLTISLSAGFYLSIAFGYLLLVYFTLNVLYSLKLKHVVILDLMVVASCYVLRAVAGIIVLDAILTPWFMMCVFLLSLFLSIGKRRHELLLLEYRGGAHRRVLDHYSEPLLNQMSGVVTTLTIISYSFYTFISAYPIYMMLTIPIVIYGMFRYLYLIHVLGKGGKPETLLYEDKGILACILLFGVSVLLIVNAAPL
ncbi:decaprenyl-phosphate phosphoribosyltransferase [Gorillibacterium massiliense]|uniref:decaprenyl-phosphate phosphoribosyltransferase n=1 Tax=Gorillibacterium massiliense TaxID=1280390 RepID=UPI0005941192|nr:decaprenyl-phosphate phosphoribosyltransferase [Gorillibacterium massiliense]